MQRIFQHLHLTPHPRHVRNTCMTHSKHIRSTVSVVRTLKVSVSGPNAYAKQVINLSWQAHVVDQEPRREVIKWNMHRRQRTAAQKQEHSVALLLRISGAKHQPLKRSSASSFHTLLTPCWGFRVGETLKEADDKRLSHMSASAQFDQVAQRRWNGFQDPTFTVKTLCNQMQKGDARLWTFFCIIWIRNISSLTRTHKSQN